MNPRARVAFLIVYHETNTFSPLRTGIEAFRRRWHRGEELRAAFAGTRTVGGGFIDGATEAGLELVPCFGALATPSGTVERAAFDEILAEIIASLAAAGPLDAVLLELHGDLAVEGVEDAEEEIVALIRRLVPGKPLAVTIDLHANMAAPRLEDVDILVGYRTNPHIDTWERGRDTAILLATQLHTGTRPYRAHRRLGVVAAPAAQRSDSEPLRSLLSLADELREQLELWDVSVHAGYAYADSIATGMGFSATAPPEHAERAEHAVDQLMDLAERTVETFRQEYPDAALAIDRALALGSPAGVADTGDNINGGSPGDTTWLAHEAARHPHKRFLGTIADAENLAACERAGVGAPVHLRLGGRASPRSGTPLEGEFTVLRLSDGVFHNVGPMATGARWSTDGAVLVRLGNLDLLIQGSPVQPNDPGMFATVGVDPTEYDVVLLKGAAALRAAWLPILTGIIDAGTPGETDSVLDRLQYRRARRDPRWS